MGANPKQSFVATEYKYESPFIPCRFEPKGRFLFGTAEDRAIVPWCLSTGKSTPFRGHDAWVGDLTFSPDGETLVSAGYDDTLAWWSATAEMPEATRKVKAHDGWIRTVAVSPDGKLLASGGNDQTVKLWNFADGSAVRTLEGAESHVYSVLFHPSGEFVLGGELKGQVHQWEGATGKRVRSFDAKALHSYNQGQAVDFGGVRSMSFSPDGKHLSCSGLMKAENPLGAVHEPLVLRFDWESAKLLVSHTMAGMKGVAWRARFH